MELIDIGVNLAHRRFAGDVDAVIQRAVDVGVEQLVATGTSVAGSERALALALRYGPRVRATAGIHPHNAREHDADAIEALRQLASSSAVVAIGECGLDYDRDFSPRPQQRACFEAQLALARELGLPTFLHQREAHADFLAILAASGAGAEAVVHCFTGGPDELDAYLELGCRIGITGYLCDERRGRQLREAVARIPPERLMLETDAPYLLPRDLDRAPPGKRNEPMFLPHILRAVAGCVGRSVEQVALETTSNARGFFRLDPIPQLPPGTSMA